MLLFIVLHHNGIYRNGQVIACTECQSWLLCPGVSVYCSLDSTWSLISSGCVQAKGYILSAAIHTSCELWIRELQRSCINSFKGYCYRCCVKLDFVTLFVSVLAALSPFCPCFLNIWLQVQFSPLLNLLPGGLTTVIDGKEIVSEGSGNHLFIWVEHL